MLHGVVSSQGSPSTNAGAHADEPPAGFVETTTCPLASAATQSEGDEQLIDVRLNPLSIVVLVQIPDAGSVLTSSAPSSPTATHSDAEAQLTLSRSSAVGCVVQSAASASVVVAISWPSTVTHRLTDAHEPDQKRGVVGLADHALGPPVGSLEVSTLPALSATKQRGSVEQAVAFTD
jgi:hypothetical protein